MIASTSTDSPPVYRVGTLTYTRAGLAMLFLWLFWGDFCFMLMEGVIPSILPLKLQGLHASNKSIGLIMTTLPQLISLIVNPVVSFKSDRYRSRWGRRIPFIVATLPMVVFFLIALGFGDDIGFWLHRVLGSLTAEMAPEQFAIAVIGVLVVAFGFFNAFVNAVFWYLFNDVVPEQLLARFSSWFRVVSLLSGGLYNYFIFPYAQDHSGAIFTGAALLYAVGFGAMCFKVKEGEYPPPPPNTDGRTGIWSSIKTYAQECNHKLYILLFAVGSAQAGIWATNPFQLFFYEATSLNLKEIGILNAVLSFTSAGFFLGAAWLADRYHALRVLIAGLLFQIFLASPAQLLWLFYKPSHGMSFHLWLIFSVVLSAPAGALIGALGVVTMRLYPKTRYGQFCSANALLRSIVFILTGILVGVYFDSLKTWIGEDRSYFCLPLWQEFFYILMLIFTWGVFILWKKHGGDTNYQPPGFEKEEIQADNLQPDPPALDPPS